MSEVIFSLAFDDLFDTVLSALEQDSEELESRGLDLEKEAGRIANAINCGSTEVSSAWSEKLNEKFADLVSQEVDRILESSKASC